MKKNHRHIIWGCLSALLLLTACDRGEEWTGDSPQMMDYLQIEGEIVGSAVTRVGTEEKLTMSFTDFGVGDDIGFFSYHDKNCPKPDRWSHRSNNDDVNYLKNAKLTYSDIGGTKKFIADAVTDASLAKFGTTFAYFPYADDKKKPENYAKANGQSLVEAASNRKGEHYIHIFTDDGQVVDLLTAQKSHYSDINYQFSHRFAMVLLYLGEGFDSTMEENKELEVYLTEHILGAHITRAEISPLPYEDFPLTIDKVSLSEGEKRGYGYSTFIAPRIEEYKLLQEQKPRTVYPVILPEGVEIDYIKVTDKTGTPQLVRPTGEAFPEGMPGGWKYPLTISMEGIAPTIYPHEIIDWNEQDVSKPLPAPGIYTKDDLTLWLEIYNRSIVKNEVKPDDLQALLTYGKHNESDNRWTFYLQDNIDCAGIMAKGEALIKALPENVTIDGRGYFLKNLLLDFEDETPSDDAVGLIGEISGGNLQNLHLDFVTVKNSGQSPPPAGCIAGRITEGQIVGCSVRQATMMCRGGVAGVLAGEMSGGKVDKCRFHGMVQAKESDGVNDEYKGMVGKLIGNDWFIGDDFINRVVLTD